MTDKNKLLKLRKLADAMYYAAQNLTTDASRLHKAMDEYHKFIIYECKEEPVSEDFETALENKVREAQDWTYIEEEGGECPLNEEFGADDLEEFARWGADWVRNNEKEPVSKSLEDDALDLEIRRFLREVHDRDTTISDVARHFAKWQRERDAKYKADKNICCMNFDDIEAARIGAYEQGKSDMKQQMMKEAVTAEVRTVEDFMGTTTFRCVCDKYKVGDKVKLIIIKEE